MKEILNSLVVILSASWTAYAAFQSGTPLTAYLSIAVAALNFVLLSIQIYERAR